MSKYLKNLVVFVIVTTILLSPTLIFAQTGGPTGGIPSGNTGGCDPRTTICNPFKQNTIRGFIEAIVNDILIPIGAVIAAVMIIYAGFLFVTARGNEQKVTEAKKALLWAVIGAAILLGAWVISEAIQDTVNDLKR